MGVTTGQDGNLYAVGGGAVDVGTTDVNMYNPKTNTWTSVAPLPDIRMCEAVATSKDGTIYAFGGALRDDIYPALATVEAYNPVTNTWTEKAPMPVAHYWNSDTQCAAVAANGDIYVFGGNNGYSGNASVNLFDVQVYHPATDAWTQAANLPGTSDTDNYLATSSNGVIYAVDVPKHILDKYNPVTNTWTMVGAIPTHTDICGNPYNGETVTSGPDGTIYFVAAAHVWDLTQVDAYNPSTGVWTSLPNHLYAAYGMSATVGTDGTLYVMGGCTQNFVPTSEVDAFTVTPPLETTTTTVIASPGPYTYGDNVTFTAIVSSGANAGTVDFFDSTSGTDLGNGPVINGTATFQTSALYAGLHLITATYSGAPGSQGSSGDTIVNIAKATPTFSNLVVQAYPAPPSLSVPYGTTQIGFSGALSVAGSNLVPGDPFIAAVDNTASWVGASSFSGALPMSVKPAGSTYTMTYSYPGDNNFNPATATLTLTVTPAQLTITPNNAHSQYGEQIDINEGVSYSGFVNGETSSVLTTPPTVTSDATTTRPVGTYTFTASGAVAPNYDISYAPGTYNIIKCFTSVNVVDKGGTYNGTPFAATVTVNDQTSLEGVTPYIAYWTLLPNSETISTSPPVNAGNYYVSAYFNGSAD